MSASSLASFEYLERLPGTTFRRLYQQPSTSLAIFRRMLPHLAKTLVMALLYMPKPLPLTALDQWVQPKSKKQKDQALSLLSRLHIVDITALSREDPQTVALTKSFGVSLRLALTGGGNHQSFGVPSSDLIAPHVDIDFLDVHARMQWEGILHYMVNSVGAGSGQEGKGPANSVKRLLDAGKLVTRGRGVGITQAGFSFLLQEANAQVWTLLLLWIENAESMEWIPSILSPPSAPTQFFPTRLATTLTSDASALRTVSAGFDAASKSAASQKGFIIIETNYRLYAYTNSPLQIAVLSLFTKLNSRYPNMVSGRISRDSIRTAISHGITSDQIITYLSTHAHPQLVKASSAAHGGPVLPPTVVDQIRLWQLENERMKAVPGFLFKDFEGQKEYEGCAKYAEEVGVLVWKNDAKRMFFVTRVEQLRDYIKARKIK
ncbi:hypothetical protein DID88_003777 [Monilinia fructigena]|uniref:RNA polymerase II transcription factor B subunit 2 n=1 Tax=Monilinia fructigena TaxID=38457 RepID=A0A395IVB5_9HELO|nr:hypothetical protein DID88_003777 [Monilinia fructigena]